LCLASNFILVSCKRSSPCAKADVAWCALQALHVLGLVLHHSEAADHNWLICTLPQISSSCRNPVEQSSVQCHISLPPTDSEQQYSRFSGFAAWLTRHGHLVGHLSIPYVNEHFVSIMEQVISSALQLATAPTVLAAPGPGAAAPVAQGCRTAPAAVVQAILAAPLKLNSFQWDRSHTPLILQPLSSLHSLTSLKLAVAGKHLTPSMTAAISRLHGLQQLSVETPKGASKGAVPLPWGETFRALSALTCLTLSTSSLMPDSLQDLPVSLQDLSLTLRPCIKRYESEAQRPLQLQHLQNLQGLVLRWEQKWCVEAVLPAQLSALSLWGPVRAVLPSELQTAEFRWCLRQGLMEQLQGLSCLTDLAVHLHYHEWRNAPTLVPVATTLQETVSALGAATQLHRLELHGRGVDLAQKYGTQLQFGTALQQLQSLHTLQLMGMQLHEADFMAISCLTGLTDLSVINGGRGMRDAVAAAIGVQLTGLQELRLHDCHWLSGAAMPAIGSLSRLTLLDLNRCSFDLNEGCLEALIGLSALQEFYFPDICSAGRYAWRGFRSALKSLRCGRCGPSMPHVC
jgi:hypothetical protein